MLGAEGAIQVYLDHAHFFAARVQKIYGFLNGVAHRAHSHNHTVCVRRAVVVKQPVIRAQLLVDGVHIHLSSGNRVVIVAVAGLSVLEEHITVLRRAAQHRLLRVQGAGAERLHIVHIHHRPQVLIVPGLNLLHLMRGTEAVKEMQERHTAL